MGRAGAGVAAIVTPEFDSANCIDLLIVRRSKMLLSEYLLAYLNSWPARTDVQCRSVGAIQAHYNTATLANLMVTVPPLTEQRELLDSIAERLDPVSQLAKAAEQEISLLHEYRTRLIADVVTGKLDVRAVAARLPDAAEEPEPVDDVEAVAEVDEERESQYLEAVPAEAEP